MIPRARSAGCSTTRKSCMRRPASRPGPNPSSWAERLARWALRSNWEVFLDSPGTHAETLGESGLARVREIVDDASVGVSVGDDADDFDGDDSDDDDPDDGRPTPFTIRYLQEQLAAQARHRQVDRRSGPGSFDRVPIPPDRDGARRRRPG